MKNSLLETNPYLKNPVAREKALVRNIASSSAIEGIRVTRSAVSGRFISQGKSAAKATDSAKSSR